MSRARRSIAALAVSGCAALIVLLAAGAASSHAAAGDGLWATVNLCDRPSYPNRFGIRARMPGTAKRGKSWMRFVTQYQTKDGWKPVAGSDSGWQLAGSSKVTFQEFGWRFQIDPPDGHGKLVLRGLVRFQWRRDGEVIDWDREYTEPGHHTNTGDPVGYSAATCTLSY